MSSDIPLVSVSRQQSCNPNVPFCRCDLQCLAHYITRMTRVTKQQSRDPSVPSHRGVQQSLALARNSNLGNLGLSIPQNSRARSLLDCNRCVIVAQSECVPFPILMRVTA